MDQKILKYIEFKISILPSLEFVQLPNDTLTHGDYQTGNILIDTVSREIVGICDWEKAEFAPRAYELARSLFYICFQATIHYAQALINTKAFLAGYKKEFPIAEEELIAGLKMRVAKMACSAWIEEMYYIDHTDRANHFIESEMKIIGMATQGGFYKELAGML